MITDFSWQVVDERGQMIAGFLDEKIAKDFASNQINWSVRPAVLCELSGEITIASNQVYIETNAATEILADVIADLLGVYKSGKTAPRAELGFCKVTFQRIEPKIHFREE